MYDRALAIFKQSLEPGHPKVVTCRKNYEAMARAAASQSV